jgi:hypothetical protein
LPAGNAVDVRSAHSRAAAGAAQASAPAAIATERQVRPLVLIVGFILASSHDIVS